MCSIPVISSGKMDSSTSRSSTCSSRPMAAVWVLLRFWAFYSLFLGLYVMLFELSMMELFWWFSFRWGCIRGKG